MIKINVKSCILKKNFDSYEYCFRIIKKTYLDKNIIIVIWLQKIDKTRTTIRLDYLFGLSNGSRE